MLKNKYEVQNSSSSEKLSQIIIHGMQEKKGLDIVLIDLRPIKHAIADFFIICTGNSSTQVQALSDSIEKHVFENTKESPLNIDRGMDKEWILIDFVDVIAHVFKKSKREKYALEELWGDAIITPIKEQ